MKNDIVLNIRTKNLLFLNIFIFETHNLPEKWHDCPEWVRGGETQKEPGSRVGGGSLQGELPGLLPGQGDPPQELAQRSSTYCWIPFCFTLGDD